MKKVSKCRLAMKYIIPGVAKARISKINKFANRNPLQTKTGDRDNKVKNLQLAVYSLGIHDPTVPCNLARPSN